MRHPRWADYENWVTLRRNNRTFLKPWEPSWDDRHLQRQAYKARLSRFKKMLQNDEAYPFHIFRADDDQLIGACNITCVQRQVAQSAQLGYWVGQGFLRQGYARAAIRAACRLSFEKLGLHRLEAAVRPENTPSVTLLEDMGFVPEGLARGYLKIDGAWRDHMIYARLSNDQ